MTTGLKLVDTRRCFRIRKRRHDNKMNLQNKKAPKTLNVTWAEERSELLCSFQSPGMFFLLTLPFIEQRFIRTLR